MDALGNPSHVGMTSDEAGHGAGINHIGLCSHSKKRSLYAMVSGDLLKGFKAEEHFKESHVNINRI